MNNIAELAREFDSGEICRRHGHNLGFKLPLQIRHESREALLACRICKHEEWRAMLEDGFAEFLKDVSEGKIK